MAWKVGWNNTHVALGGSMMSEDNTPNLAEKQEALLERRVQKRVKAALKEQIQFGATTTTRGLSPSTSARDLSQANQRKIYEQAYYVYKTNPLAMAAIDIMADFVVGEGFFIEANAGRDSAIQKEFDMFWKNPNSNWEQRHENKVKELGLYGNQYYPIAINEFTGRVELGYIDPSRVRNVEFLNGNTEVVKTIFIDPEDQFEDPVPMEVVREVSDASGTRLEGDVFFLNVNRVSNAMFGTSDILASLEWMDIYDQFLFGAAERNLLQESFVWHYKWEGLTEEEIEAKAEKYKSAPRPGSTRHTNEKCSVEAVGPENNGNPNTKIMADLVKMYALMALRYPESWLTEGGDTNFATAKAQSTPIFKRLRRRQKLWVANIDLIMRFVAENLLSKGMISQEEFDQGWTIVIPDIAVQDPKDSANTLNMLSQSLSVAESSGWISKLQASEAYTRAAARMGLNVQFDGLPDINEPSDEIPAQPSTGVPPDQIPESETDYEADLNKHKAEYLTLVNRVG